MPKQGPVLFYEWEVCLFSANKDRMDILSFQENAVGADWESKGGAFILGCE
jgi:hypothetical protein